MALADAMEELTLAILEITKPWLACQECGKMKRYCGICHDCFARFSATLNIDKTTAAAKKWFHASS